jgi:hypothetical protein
MDVECRNIKWKASGSFELLTPLVSLASSDLQIQVRTYICWNLFMLALYNHFL